MSSHWCQDCGCENGWSTSADIYVAWKTVKLKSCAFAIFIDFSNFLCLLFTLWTKKVKQPSNHWGEWLFAKMAEHVLNPFWWDSNDSPTPGLWPDLKIIGLSWILRIQYSVLAWFQLPRLQCCLVCYFFKDLQIQNASCYGKLFDMAMPVVSRVDFSIQGEGSTENPEFLSKQIQTVRGGNLYPYMFFQRICTAVVLICIQHRRVSLKIQLYYSSSNLFSCSYRVSRSWNLFTFTTNKRQFQWFWSL